MKESERRKKRGIQLWAEADSDIVRRLRHGLASVSRRPLLVMDDPNLKMEEKTREDWDETQREREMDKKKPDK